MKAVPPAGKGEEGLDLLLAADYGHDINQLSHTMKKTTLVTWGGG